MKAINIFQVLIFSIKIILFASVASAEIHSVQNQEFGFGIDYSDIFTPETSEYRGAVLVLRSRAARYPTFNILVGATEYPVSVASKEYGKTILEEYRAAGIADAKILTVEPKVVDGYQTQIAKLSFTSGDQLVNSLVTVISQPSKHFILTMVASAEDAQAPILYDELLSSFRLLKKPVTIPSETKPSQSLVLAFIIGIVLVAVTVLRRFKLLRQR